MTPDRNLLNLNSMINGNEPNGETQPDFNKIDPTDEKWVYFAMGYLAGIIAGGIVIYIITK